jgi:hypothetical protein
MKRTNTIADGDFGIIEYKVIAIWNDGMVEDLAPDLPEALNDELQIYLNELDELRSIEREDYNESEEAA